MSTTKLMSGRIDQKLRTRKDLLEAAQRLLRGGIIPTFDDVAMEAQVSRATVYRYFSNIDLLLAEAPLDAATVSPEEVLEGVGPNTHARVQAVQQYFHNLVADHETYFRRFMRASMDQWLSAQGKPEAPLRNARRMVMLEEALKPGAKHLDDPTYVKLVCALSALTSLEAFIALRDVCRLDNEEAKEICTWAGQILTEAVLKGAASPSQAKLKKPARGKATRRGATRAAQRRR